jgi:hypothetical protein
MKWMMLGVVLGACGITPNATLAQIPDPVIGVQLVPQTDDNDDDLIQTSVSLSVYTAPMANMDVEPADCPTIADEPAMFDHTSIDVSDRGEPDDFEGCNPPDWTTTLALGPDAGTSITFPDGFGATFPPGVLGARIAHLTGGHPWSFTAGETFQITWSSADDLATLALISVIASWKTGTTTVPITALAFDATTITLQMPDPLPPGDGVFDIFLDRILDDTPTSCTGAIRCEATNPRRFDHTAHVD